MKDQPAYSPKSKSGYDQAAAALTADSLVLSPSTELFSCADRLALLCSQLKSSDWGIQNRRFIHAFNNLYSYCLDRLAGRFHSFPLPPFRVSNRSELK